MPISIDRSTPAITSGFGNFVTSLQTPGFSPPANSLITVLVAWDYLAQTTTAPILSMADTKNNVYTPGPAVYDTQFNQAQIWYTYVTAAPGPMTCTVTANTSAQHGWIIQPYVLTGASPIQTGASATAFSASSTVIPYTGTITTTQNGSYVLVTAAVANSSVGNTQYSTTDTLSSTPDATENATFLTADQQPQAGTGNPGPLLLGWTPGTGGAGYQYAWAALEILPATITPELSAPYIPSLPGPVTRPLSSPPAAPPAPANIIGTSGGIALTAPAGTIQAFTGSPGRRIAPCKFVPERGKTLGINAGTISATITGAAATVTLTPAAGSIQAVTGSPGKTIRPRTFTAKGSVRGISQGTEAAAETGITSPVTVTAIPGTIQAVTGSPGKAIRPRTFVRQGKTRGASAGTEAIQTAGVTGNVTVAAPAGTINVVSVASSSIPNAIRPRTFVRQGKARGISSGTAGTAIPGVTATILTAASGSVQAVTGSPGKTIRPRVFLPRKGAAAGVSSGTHTINTTGVTPAATVAAPAGTVQAVTGSPGRTTRPRVFVPRKGTAYGASSGTAGSTITGVTTTVTLTVSAGTIQAVTGSPGRIIRPKVFLPHKGSAGGISPGTEGVIEAETPLGITVTAPAGSIQAVTGSPGKVTRPRVFVPRKGTPHGVSGGTAGTTVTGAAVLILLAAPTGNIQAVTGSPGKTIRPRVFLPRTGVSHGASAGTTGATITVTPANITVTAPAGSAQAVTGSPGKRAHGQPLIRRGQTSPASAGTLTQNTTGTAAIVIVSPQAGLVSAGGNIAVPGVTATVLIAASGSVQAFTGSPGQTIRPRTFVRKGAVRGFSAGTIGATITGVAAPVTVAVPAGSVQAFTGSPGRIIRPRVFVRQGSVTTRAHNVSAGTAGTTVTGVSVSVTVITSAGTIQAVTGSPGKTIRPRTFVRQGTARGVSQGTEAITGITANPPAITVTANAGLVYGYTVLPGRVIRPRTFIRQGKAVSIAHGVSAGTISTTISGIAATATVTAGSGTIQAVTGSPGKTIRPRTFVHKGAARGVTTGTTTTGTAGPATAVQVSAPAGSVYGYTVIPPRTIRPRTFVRKGAVRGISAGTISTTITGVTATITAAASGTIQAVTGSPGRRLGPRFLVRQGKARWTLPAGTSAIGVNGTASNITAAAPPGTVAAFAALANAHPWPPIRSRTPSPAKGRSHGLKGTLQQLIAGTDAYITVSAPAGAVQSGGNITIPGVTAAITLTPNSGYATGAVAAPAAPISVTAPAGQVPVIVAAPAATITVTTPAIPGWVVLTEKRYVNWAARLRPRHRGRD